MSVLNSEKKMDWLDELLLERVTVPGQRYMEDHRLAIMGDNGLFMSVYVRTLSGKRMEFNYDHAVLFALQESREEDLLDVGMKHLNSHPSLCLNSCNANILYEKERVVSGTDLADRYDPFFDTLKYRRKPEEDIIRRCTEVLDYIDGKLQKASTINGVYESGIEDEKKHIAWQKISERRYSSGYRYAVIDIENTIKTPDTIMIYGAGMDASGCVCVFLDKTEQAIKWIAKERELNAGYALGEQMALRITQGLERAIQTNTVEEYFQHNYEVNKAFIEKHYPFRLPDKWNAVVR